MRRMNIVFHYLAGAWRSLQNIEAGNLASIASIYLKLSQWRDEKNCLSKIEFKGFTPSACWNKVFKWMRKIQIDNFDDLTSGRESERTSGSDSNMFGFLILKFWNLLSTYSSGSYKTSLVISVVDLKFYDGEY